MERKPRLFIGCSAESLIIADAINENLDHSCEVTIWRNGTFRLANNTIDSLTEKALSVDFSVFIFSPDDLATIRDNEEKVVRDNVIFELGLFIGTIGKQRCFIVKPRGVDLHFPTDLLGVTTADYEPNRSDGDITSALNYACTLIKKEVDRLGLIRGAGTYTSTVSNLQVRDEDLTDIDFRVLAALMSTATSSPSGLALWEIKNVLNNKTPKVDVSSIKLERLGYLEKENDVDHNGWDYYAYKISQNGLEIILRNEQKLYSLYEPTSEDNDLPF
ncbi:putative nucleotide-binding protein with TIR-like domain [Pontibacter ummariensis]|uniref:Predicted nucleotide-binding protein containing TIR-like domain-containing protein n=1 Tax=Pontibacter ummariensis TaxID=1610492 RepID=A0A239CKY6_9BACT|nr:nucleotide-binding protein [Pontibacter ummariensis]PRY14974.1 putative nucleotide-binding protein with TIR-like domain [Pontibacter ummariensis]SNS20368.1 Predicted nucleotide-binding protein containing TIR-like domain-containing protein [Pontibacter ummariensis]